MTFDKQFYDRFKYLLLQEKLDNLYVVNDEIIYLPSINRVASSI